MQNTINKGRRNELKQLKYKRRLKILAPKLYEKAVKNPKGDLFNMSGYKSHGKPCSCTVCSPYKYNRAKMKRLEFDGSKLLNGKAEMAI